MIGSLRDLRRRNLFTSALLLAALAPFAACADGDTDEDVGPAEDDGLSTEVSEISVPGDWNPTADVRNAGRTQFVAYEGPPAWNGGVNCGGSLLAGTRQLGDFIKANFPGRVTSYGGYACRQNTANASQTSVHGTGRAIDLFVPMSGGSADNTKGDEVAAFLIRNAQAIGVQYIIWDHADWSGDHGGDKMGHYTGPVPHIDHLHVELNHAGANRQTPWFQNGGGGGGGGTECAVHADNHRLYCTNTGGAAMHSQPTLASVIVNRLRTTFSYFECWGTGDLHGGGNHTWYRTIGDDNNNRGWIPAVDVSTTSAFDANPSAAGLPHC